MFRRFSVLCRAVTPHGEYTIWQKGTRRAVGKAQQCESFSHQQRKDQNTRPYIPFPAHPSSSSLRITSANNFMLRLSVLRKILTADFTSCLPFSFDFPAGLTSQGRPFSRTKSLPVQHSNRNQRHTQDASTMLTEMAVVQLQADVDLKTPTSSGSEVVRNFLLQTLKAPGARFAYYGQSFEQPTTAFIVVGWESAVHHTKYTASP